MKKEKVEAFTKSFTIHSLRVTKQAPFPETINDSFKERGNTSICICSIFLCDEK
jgi:hypothetical protein